MELTLKQILERFPLRVSITDYCNLHCFFCSNEGMKKDRRNSTNMDVDDFAYLLNVLANNGLKHISLTGGDPTLHPELERIVDIINEANIKRSFFHTNGIELDKNLIMDQLYSFTKIAVSIHATDFVTWRKITKGTKEQYDKLTNNLSLLAQEGYGKRIEIKHVPMHGINDADEMIKGTLDLCARYNFKFKFLNFEPIEHQHQKLIIPIKDLVTRLEELGCRKIEREWVFRGQTDYLPANFFEYNGTEGFAIEIGCGEQNVCRACYKSNEIFLTPSFELKPCHITSMSISLKDAIDNRDHDGILSKIVDSRIFLFQGPGAGRTYWNQD